MLFDLRSRGRRRTVQVIYLGLAIVMMLGLVLVGVGTGGSGGLLNAFTNSGSGSANNSAAVNAALRETKAHPGSADAWSNLVTARWEDAQQGANFDSTTSTYTKSGKAQLNALVSDYERYSSLTNSPSIEATRIAAQSYVVLTQWSGAANAWETVAAAQPSVNAFSCLALTSFAASQTRKGSLAVTQALALTPKLERLELKDQFKSAESSKTTAAQYAASSC